MSKKFSKKALAITELKSWFVLSLINKIGIILKGDRSRNILQSKEFQSRSNGKKQESQWNEINIEICYSQKKNSNRDQTEKKNWITMKWDRSRNMLQSKEFQSRSNGERRNHNKMQSIYKYATVKRIPIEIKWKRQHSPPSNHFNFISKNHETRLLEYIRQEKALDARAPFRKSSWNMSRKSSRW